MGMIIAARKLGAIPKKNWSPKCEGFIGRKTCSHRIYKHNNERVNILWRIDPEFVVSS